MTNEKDREEHSAAYNHAAVFHRRLVAAQNALIAYPSVVTRLVRGYGVDVNEKQIDAWLRDALGESAEAEIRDHDARIRTEAYREGFLDGASPDGTYVETERDRLLVAEAVKEERERCVEYAVSWMISNKNTEIMDNTDVLPCVTEILGNLSGNNGASRG